LSPPAGGSAIPPLAPHVRLHPSGSKGGGLLHQPSTGLVVRAGAVEFELLRRFDGTDAAHVRCRLERECGIRLALGDVEEFARRAGDIGLLGWSGKEKVRRSRWRGVSWSLRLWNPDRVFSWCAPRAAFLFRTPSLLIAGLAIAVALATFVRTVPASSESHVASWSHVLIFLVLLNVVSIAHECGHGLALHRYGGHVPEIGVRFVLGWPCWYCDITESYLLPRMRQRVAVLVAGPFSQAVVCAAIILAARGPSRYAVVLRTSAAVLGALTALNFMPFVRSDGYYLLTEIAGIPNLRKHAWNWLASVAARRRMHLGLSRPKCVIVAGYALASAGFLALVVGRAVALLGRVFAGKARFSVATIVAAITIVVIATTTFRGRSVTP
jgi:putative peptide zinc metalloprotease protein